MLAILLYDMVGDLLHRGSCEPHAIHDATSIWRKPLVESRVTTWHSDALAGKLLTRHHSGVAGLKGIAFGHICF